MVRGTGIRALTLISLVVGLLHGCASGYESSWTNVDAGGPLNLRDDRVATFLVVSNEDRRRVVETLMAEEIASRGVETVPGFTLLTRARMADLDQARQTLVDNGIDAVLVFQPVGREQSERYVPGRGYYENLGYDSLWGYWSAWGSMIHEPGHYEVDQTVYLEAMVFSVTRDKLLWGGVTSVNSASEVGTMFESVVRDTGSEMRKAGLLN